MCIKIYFFGFCTENILTLMWVLIILYFLPCFVYIQGKPQIINRMFTPLNLIFFVTNSFSRFVYKNLNLQGELREVKHLSVIFAKASLIHLNVGFYLYNFRLIKLYSIIFFFIQKNREIIYLGRSNLIFFSENVISCELKEYLIKE